MSYPFLYESGTKNFDNNGIGVLSDAASCIVVEERNGAFELTLKYPITGLHYSDIATGRIILAKPNQVDEHQPFKIYSISKPLNGFITAKAEHISYMLNGISVKPFTAENANGALQGLQSFATSECPFTFLTDIITEKTFKTKIPHSARALMGGIEESILALYGGEFKYDGFNVYLYANRGENRGVVIKYGKNLTAFEQEESISNVYTHVHPFWLSLDEETYKELPEVLVPTGTFDHTRTLALDLSADFSEEPTTSELREKAEEYIEVNKLGEPAVSLTVSYAQLEQTEEYKNIALLERVYLCDYVTVKFPALNVDTSAQAIKVTYDVLADRVTEIGLGDAKNSIVNNMVDQKKELDKKSDAEQVKSITSVLTDTILGAKGGSVRLLDTDLDGKLDTLYIADHEDPLQAVKVWRFNYQGWAASKTGYQGEFVMGATLDDGFIADFITAGVLNADLIKAGVIKSKDGQTFALDVDAGTIVSKIPNGEAGVLETNIQETLWSVQYKDFEGNVISGLTFDFENEKFLFDGAGHFTGSINVGDKFVVDSNGNLTTYGDARLFNAVLYALEESGSGGYLKVGGDGVSIYNKHANELVKIGYPISECDYPYIMMKTQSDLFKSGMIKRFSDGMWFGNSEPKDSYGLFEAKVGYQGIFFSFDTGKTYVVSGKDMQNIYTGDAVAKFG